MKTTHTEEQIQIWKVANLQHSTRIVKNQSNSKHIIQILQIIVIDYFSTDSYQVDMS